MNTHQIHLDVRQYYGEVLKTKADLQTSACCAGDAMPIHLRAMSALIEDEIQDRFYGCGCPIPHALNGCTVLDLGCGTGRDVYLAAQLVGPEGRVIGVDMTENQLEVARRYLPQQMKRFGYSEPNVEFKLGYMEDLNELGIATESVDVVISNCVINLAPDKEPVFKEILRVLKTGGEAYFSDVFVDRRLSREMQTDPVMVGECLGGALYVEDFRRMLARLGVADYRIVKSELIEPTSHEVAQRMGNARFYSLTVRFFKLEELEDRCEDYGQVAWYLGGLPESPNEFVLDDHHTFLANKPMAVCSNTASMLAATRFRQFFRVEGDCSHHLGLFDCASELASTAVEESSQNEVGSLGCC